MKHMVRFTDAFLRKARRLPAKDIPWWQKPHCVFFHFLQRLWREETVYTLLALTGAVSLVLGIWLSYQLFQAPTLHYLPTDESIRDYLQAQALSQTSETSLASEEASIVVEVAGAVRKPGVVAVPKGSRVQDVLSQSGGFLPDADMSYIHHSVHLAAYVSDQQKIYIPFNGESVTTHAQDQTVMPQKESSVSKEELLSINGIGEARASQILAAAPFSSASDIQERAKISATIAEEVRHLYQKE